VINWLLILINCYCFYLELHLHNAAALDKFITHWAVVPSRLWADPAHQWVTLITAEFLHGGWMHIIGNMLFLFIFGDNIEDRLGHLRYLLYYLVCGILAGLAHVFATALFANEASTLLVPSLGASGAISGVLGGYMLLFPTNRVTVLISWFATQVPAFIAIGLWFVFQLISGLGVLGSGSQAAASLMLHTSAVSSPDWC
jgi:membrane associated rhomboid family serine protease